MECDKRRNQRSDLEKALGDRFAEPGYSHLSKAPEKSSHVV